MRMMSFILMGAGLLSLIAVMVGCMVTVLLMAVGVIEPARPWPWLWASVPISFGCALVGFGLFILDSK